ncbi:SulP family inorganic anion transporter [Mycobacterium ulcerans]|uniref:Transmembrane carbonic anhydrase, SulP n=1 Tax=Mycobacterium ulcerans (strain Agy99) TaxID=362242 RepID=A0PLW1_MYCUA|nr:SulP family inorganic anion transporter [Mycobacterium ulcerans]ABL03330.1 transmembrane carbonic anhydrase, SulP [Mycobacterium ulcerans Agy99]MEB3904421.1 SulP family inorganic anion transporter [Mycobacterium ulcerans]MEB3908621.1 SulP family inorganic anion transporter [Mycobacterium ulcerans]MEB3918918.1 SulP family inorganic anion transporter [Mycobacterium ulcerans]MEB3922988.1 SulP family inorganic anion transporter [Mycobacterium ulcerans]
MPHIEQPDKQSLDHAQHPGTPEPPTTSRLSRVSQISRPDRVRSVIRHDLPASLVVFLVALPLSLGIAIASDAPVLAGLIAAVVGGIIGGALGGSPLQVSGPAAGLTVVVADLIAEFGWGITCFITAVAGLMQILLGFSRVARAALAISPVVVHAMLAGIGITIALQQTHVLLGGESHSTAWANVVELPAQIVGAHRPGVILGLLVIAIMVAWRWAPAKVAPVPGPLVAIVVVTVVSVVFPFHVSRITLEGSVVDALQLPAIPHGNWGAIVIGIITVTLITSVQSLLTAVATDRMHSGPTTELNRELIGQGASNVVSGAIGGLPIAGVIVRSAANIKAGAKTRASTILHGFWVLLFALPFAGLIEQIPSAALAGLLIVIGIQLLQPAHIETAVKTGDFAIYLVTIVAVVFLNLLHGVMIGLALAIAMTGWRVLRAKVEAHQIDGEWRVVVEGACTFLSLPRLTRVLASVPDSATVTLHIAVNYLDHAAHQAITDWQRRHHATGGKVRIDGALRRGHFANDGTQLVHDERSEAAA